MKKIMFILFGMLCTSICFSQVILKPVKPLPTGQGGKPNLPTPNIPALKPDLAVTAISYISGVKDIATGEYQLTLHLIIKNNGGGKAEPCKLFASYQRESTHGTYWANSFSGIDLPPIAGGVTISGNYTFRIKLSALGLGTYTIPVKAFIDKDNNVKESNELNNLSSAINVSFTL